MTMQISPSTYFTSFAQAILFRDASIDVVWREMAAVAVIGAFFFGGALWRFRGTIVVAQT
jgi:ABC-2 type transport system permease protein